MILEILALAIVNRTKIINKEIQIEKEIHNFIHIKKTQIVHKKTKLINEYSKVLGYKIIIHDPTAFLSTDENLSEREIKKTITFTIASTE